MDRVFFYSLEDAAEKLNRTEEDVCELTRQGRPTEFRDGYTLLLLANEVEAAISSISSTSPSEGRSKSAAPAGLKVKYSGIIKAVRIETSMTKEPLPYVDLRNVRTIE